MSSTPLRRPVWISLASVLAGLLPSATPRAHAVETQTRSWRSSADFAAGEMDHVSVSPQGRVVLSPDYNRLADIDDPVAWSLADLAGDVLVATGHDGRVLRVAAGATAGARPEVYFDAAELEVTALASDARGTVWLATSPDGRVYRAHAGARPEPFFDPEERYIWALLPGPDGTLLVATGDRGAVYRVSPAGTAVPALSAEETHILSLALATDGTLYAGSGGNGYVYRVAGDGRALVVLDTAGSEVKALALDRSGNLWAASTGRPGPSLESAPALSEPAQPPITVTPTDEPRSSGLDATTTSSGAPAPAQQPQPSPTPSPGSSSPATALPQALVTTPFTFGGPRQSWLYRIRPDGLPEEIWRSTSETVHAMALAGERLVLGTGEEGKLFSLDVASGVDSILLDLPGAQVTALLARGSRLVAATSNLASLWSITPDPASEGAYTSTVVDAGHFATWGRLGVRGSGRLRVETRSGNTEKPGQRWSAWEAAEGEVRSPRARYLQYRVKISPATGGSSEGGELAEVELAWLPHNLAPRLRHISVLDPHVELVSSSSPAQGLASAPGRSLPPTRDRARAGDIRLAPREQETYGARSARWDAEDSNGDTLVYTVTYRGEHETAWKPLAADLVEPFVALDATAFADGRYLLRVAASDRPSNPEDRSLSAELVSEPFTIDNTAPGVVLGEPRQAGDKLLIRAELRDATSALRWAEWSLDGGMWRPLLPEDQVFDEPQESVEIAVPPAAPGEHTVLVRAGDAARNVGSGRTTFRR